MNGLTTFFSFITAVGAIGFAIGQWKNGKTKANADGLTEALATIKALRERIISLEESYKNLDDQHKKNHDEIIRLQEQLKYKDSVIKEYLGILQNRDPQLTEFIKFSMESTKYFQGVVPSLVLNVDKILKIVDKRSE